MNQTTSKIENIIQQSSIQDKNISKQRGQKFLHQRGKSNDQIEDPFMRSDQIKYRQTKKYKQSALLPKQIQNSSRNEDLQRKSEVTQQEKKSVIHIHKRHYSEAFNPHRPNIQSTNQPHSGVATSETSLGMIKSHPSSYALVGSQFHYTNLDQPPNHSNSEQQFNHEDINDGSENELESDYFNQFTVNKNQIQKYHELNENISDSDSDDHKQREGSGAKVINKNRLEGTDDYMMNREVQFSLKQMHRMTNYNMTTDEVIQQNKNQIPAQKLQENQNPSQKNLQKQSNRKSQESLHSQTFQINQRKYFNEKAQEVKNQPLSFETPLRIQNQQDQQTSRALGQPIPHHKERNSSHNKMKSPQEQKVQKQSPSKQQFFNQTTNSTTYHVKNQKSVSNLGLASPPSKISSEDLIPLKYFQKSYDSKNNFDSSNDLDEDDLERHQEFSPSTKLNLFEVNKSYINLIENLLLNSRGLSPTQVQNQINQVYQQQQKKQIATSAKKSSKEIKIYVSPKKQRDLNEKISQNVIENSEFIKPKAQKLSPGQVKVLAKKLSQSSLKQPNKQEFTTPDQSPKKMGREVQTSINKMNEKLIIQKTYRQINQVLSYFLSQNQNQDHQRNGDQDQPGSGLTIQRKHSFSNREKKQRQSQLDIFQVYNAFYYLGTFQFKYQQESQPSHLTQIKEHNFTIQLWNFLIGFHRNNNDFQWNIDNDLQTVEEKQFNQKIDAELLRSLLEILFLNKDKGLIIQQIQDVLGTFNKRQSFENKNSGGSNLLQEFYDDSNSYQNIDGLEINDLVEQFEALNMNQLGKIHLFRLEKDMKISNQLRQRDFDCKLQDRECKFSPQINNNSKVIDSLRNQSFLHKSKSEDRIIAAQPSLQNRHKISTRQLQRVEQLYHYNKQTQEKLSLQKLQKDQMEMREATFKPQISNRSREMAAKSPSQLYSGIGSPSVNFILNNSDKSKILARGQSPTESMSQQILYKKQINHSGNTDQTTFNNLMLFRFNQQQKKFTPVLNKNQQSQNIQNSSGQLLLENTQNSLQFEESQRYLPQNNDSQSQQQQHMAQNEFQEDHETDDQHLFQDYQKLSQTLHNDQKQEDFTLKFQLSNNKEYNISISIDSDPADLAFSFCQQYGIVENSLKIELRNLIQDSINRYLSQANY